MAREENSGLTLEEARSVFAYDRETGDLRWKVAVNSRALEGDPAGCIQGNGYLVVGYKGFRFSVHRLVWFLSHGAWPACQLDHINRDKTDNRLCNLREATESQNHANKLGRKPLKGVRRSRDKYGAQIVCRGQRHWLGTYSTPEEAHRAYAAAAQQFFGEFARAN